MRSADMPGPGRRFGHDVIMRHLRLSLCASAGVASAPTRPAAPPRARPRRVILPIMISLKTNSNVLAYDFKSLRKSRQDGALPPCTVRYFRARLGSAEMEGGGGAMVAKL